MVFLQFYAIILFMPNVFKNGPIQRRKILKFIKFNSCPVCRHSQTPEMIPNQTCSKCTNNTDLWMCLICGNVGCGRNTGAHAYK